MAFSVSTYLMVANGGTDGATGNGAGFDAGQTAGMATDGAATFANTSVPVFSSASYSFVAGDVGAWVYIASGTNWIAGWYSITAVSSGTAFLNASAGAATAPDSGLNIFTGCAVTASPTGATWSIDYSRQATPRFTYTDLTAAGAGSTWTSVGNPFGIQQVGNILACTGTGAVATRACITSVTGVTATFDKAVSTAATATATGKLGGAFASIGGAGSVHLGGNLIWIRYNATPFTTTGTNANTNLGRLTLAAGTAANPTIVRGFDVTPGDETANRPILKWGINALSNGIIGIQNFGICENLVIDGNRSNFTATKGFNGGSATNTIIRRCKITSCNAGGFSTTGTAILTDVEFTDCTSVDIVSVAGAPLVILYGVNFHDNVAVNSIGVTTGRLQYSKCIFDTTTTSGVAVNITGAALVEGNDSTIYNMAGDGIAVSATAANFILFNVYAEACGGWGFNYSAQQPMGVMLNCGGYNNTSGNYQTTAIPSRNVINFKTPNASAFTNAASKNFLPNATALAGALLRSTGFPTIYAGGVTQNYNDIGAFRHQDPAGGGGTIASAFC